MDTIDTNILNASPVDLMTIPPPDPSLIKAVAKRLETDHGPYECDGDCSIHGAIRRHVYLFLRMIRNMPHYLALISARKVLQDIQLGTVPPNVDRGWVEDIKNATDLPEFVKSLN